MIASFADRGTEDVYDGEDTKAARKACPPPIWPVARRKLDQLNRAARLQDLKAPPSNRLERLRRDRQGQWAIRVNEQYRICFRWDADTACDVELTDYH